MMLLLLVLLLAATPAWAADDSPGVIAGQSYDAASRLSLRADINVSCGDDSFDIRADELGRFAVSVLPGLCRVRVAAEGYRARSFDATITAGNKVDLQVGLHKASSRRIVATISSEEGGPLPGYVQIRGGGPAHALANEKGQFEVVLEPGHYEFAVWAPSYKLRRFRAEVKADSPEQLHFKVALKPGGETSAILGELIDRRGQPVKAAIQLSGNGIKPIRTESMLSGRFLFVGLGAGTYRIDASDGLCGAASPVTVEKSQLSHHRIAVDCRDPLP